MNVYIWWAKDYSAMQWPAPEWFHIPLYTEWQWLKTIMDWLSLNTWDKWRINLHMPFAGGRDYSDAVLYNQGSYGNYWSSSFFSASSNLVRSLLLYSSTVNVNFSNYRANGYSVRCFKNSFETPTSSWTIITWTLWWAWIFRNKTNWLISITSNWTTWYTIQDKNLWATTVYNNGNTLTQANMGNIYQWWNNYWFPSTWSVTTSSTKVNASAYWPWNYYSSSTFIIRSDDWSSVKNDNLRWWVTWIVTPVELQNDYIGEVYEYSYDFRGKTKSQVTADWWQAWSWDTWTSCWSNWLYQSSHSWGGRLIRQFNTNMANAKRIVSTAKFSMQGTYDWMSRWIATSFSRANSTNIYLIYWGTYSNMQIAWVSNSIAPSISSWTYKYQYIVDLENKTATLTFLTWTSFSKTVSITDSQINTIRNNDVYWLILVDTNCYLQTVSITIE